MKKDFLLDDYQNFIIGANYFASHAGTNMWKEWDEKVVEKDFSLLSQYGIEVLRVFPIWSDCQPITTQYIHGKSWDNAPREVMLGEMPLDETKEGIAGVDIKMFEHFDTMCLLAEKYNIKLIVGLITGFMSDRRFVPPAFNERNIFTDPFAQKWTIKFVRYFVERYKECKTISAWDLGNEVCWLDQAGSCEASYSWASLVTNTIKSIDSQRPVATGLDWTDTTSKEWNTMDMGEIMDIMTSHPYACFSYASGQAINEMNAIRYVSSTTVALGDMAKKPCLLEEVGAIGYSTLNERSEAGFMHGILFDSWVNNCYGMMWWCAFDQGELSHNPYRWNGRGSDYGLFDKNYRPKASVIEAKKFYDLLRSLPFKNLPERIRDTVCIVPRGVGNKERDFVAVVDTLAKQAGLDVEFSFADQCLPDATLYILPSVSSPQYVNKDRFVELLNKVKNGADLFVSMDNCYLRWFNEVTGLDVFQRRAYNGSGLIEIEGNKIESHAKYEYICDNVDGEIIAENQNGNPVFVCHKLGNGRVYSYLAPLELSCMIDSNFVKTNSYCIYKYLRDNINTKKVAKCKHPEVGLTEHILNENERILVLINYTPKKTKVELELIEDYRIDEIYYGRYEGDMIIDENDAIILKIKK